MTADLLTATANSTSHSTSYSTHSLGLPQLLPARPPHRPVGRTVNPPILPWTTARCNRLLRPLRTRLEAVRRHVLARAAVEGSDKKEDEQVDSVNASTRAFPATLNVQTPEKTITHGGRQVPVPRTGGKDPDWMPSAKANDGYGGGRKGAGVKKYKRKRGCDAMSGKGRSREQMRPGEISVPSPLLVRMRSVPQPSRISTSTAAISSAAILPTSSTATPEPCNRSASASSATTSSLRTRTGHRSRRLWLWPSSSVLLQSDMGNKTSDQMHLFNSLLEALENLLRATAISFDPSLIHLATSSTTKPATRNTKSLFATALRQLPSYISLIDAIERDANPDYKEDTTSVIFSELETFSTSTKPGSGWAPLRIVVRAQATTLLRQAVEDGIFSMEMVRAVVVAFAKAGARREALGLVNVAVGGKCPISTPVDYPSETMMKTMRMAIGPKALGLVDDIAAITGDEISPGYVIRMLHSMLKDGRIAVQMLTRRAWERCWSQWVIPALIGGDAGGTEEAASFVATVVRGACGVKSFCGEHESKTLSMTIAPDPLSNMLSSLMCILASLSLTTYAQAHGEVTPPTCSPMTILSSLVADMAVLHERASPTKVNSCETSSQISSKQACRRATVVATMIVLLTIRNELCLGLTDFTLDDCVNLLDRIASFANIKLHTPNLLLDTLPPLLLNIATCATRMRRSDTKNELPVVQSLLKQLLMPDLSTSPSDKMSPSTPALLFLRRLALATASTYATSMISHADISSSLELVDEIEAFIDAHPLEDVGREAYLWTRVKNKASTSPDSETAGEKATDAYRWEPGLAEWIAATPVSKVAKRSLEKRDGMKLLQVTSRTTSLTNRPRLQQYSDDGEDDDDSEDELSGEFLPPAWRMATLHKSNARQASTSSFAALHPSSDVEEDDHDHQEENAGHDKRQASCASVRILSTVRFTNPSHHARFHPASDASSTIQLQPKRASKSLLEDITNVQHKRKPASFRKFDACSSFRKGLPSPPASSCARKSEFEVEFRAAGSGSVSAKVDLTVEVDEDRDELAESPVKVVKKAKNDCQRNGSINYKLIAVSGKSRRRVAAESDEEADELGL